MKEKTYYDMVVTEQESDAEKPLHRTRKYRNGTLLLLSVAEVLVKSWIINFAAVDRDA